MVKQKEPTHRGRVGSLLFYDRQETHCVRKVPTKIVQTIATKKSAADFGRASKIARVVRKRLIPSIPFPADKNMQSRLRTAIYQWLGASGNSREECINHLAEIRDFQFTRSGYSFAERWKINPEVTIPKEDLLQIKWPAFIPKQSISAPLHTRSVKLKLAAGSCHTETGIATGGSAIELLFSYDKKKVSAQTLSLNFPMPKGSLVIIGASLEYTISKSGTKKINRDKTFMPSAIITAMYI